MKKVSPVTGQATYPGEGWTLTSEYCTQAYYDLFGDWHTGHDLARTQEGGEPVYAVAKGVVKWADSGGDQGFGNVILIEHEGSIYSRYAHLSHIAVVRGDEVVAGDTIGRVGETGRATGPHLHFDLCRKCDALGWPGKDKNRVLQDYIDPFVWYASDEARFGPGGTSGLSERLRVTATDGLNVRARPSTSAKVNYRLPYRAVIEVRELSFLADSYTWRELIGGGWIAQEYTEHEDGDRWEPETVELSPIYENVVTPNPTVVARRGVHASAGGWMPTDQELELVRANGVESALLVAAQMGQARDAIRHFREAGIRDFIFRATGHGQITSDPSGFIDASLPCLHEYRDALQAEMGGTARFIVTVHNEPNLSVEGFGRAWQNGVEFTRWYLVVVHRYRQEFPGILIGFPALSPGGNVDIPNVRRMDEWEFASQCVEGIEASDWVGVHAYFTGDGSDIDLKPSQWRAMARGRSVIVTEGGPADTVQNDGIKLHNMYARCAAAGVPVIAWVLNGAGAWMNADWVINAVRDPELGLLPV